MSDLKMASRKRKGDPLSEQQCVPVLASVGAGGFLSEPLVYSQHAYALGQVPANKQLFLMHSSASSSSGSLLDESSRGEFSAGDTLSELDYSVDGSRRKQRHETSLGQLTKKFVSLLSQAQDGVSDLHRHFLAAAFLRFSLPLSCDLHGSPPDELHPPTPLTSSPPLHRFSVIFVISRLFP